MNSIYNFIYNFNLLSETPNYKCIFYSFAILSFIISYSGENIIHKNKKTCNNLFVNVINMIHHSLVYFIYIGFVAPISILWIVTILLLFTLFSWVFINNMCILTIIENYLCNIKINKPFHDILHLTSSSLDKYITKHRILIVITMVIIVIMRLMTFYIYSPIIFQAHRGGKEKYPENTILAFQYALDNNINTLELDLQLTKDKQIIIFHDMTIKNDTIENNLYNNLYNTNTNANIKDLTLNEIHSFPSSLFDNQNNNIYNKNIPLLEELINIIKHKKNNIKLNIEIKTNDSLYTSNEVEEFVDILMGIIYKHNIQEQIIIQSFDTRALSFIKQKYKNIITSYLVEYKHENTKFIDMDTIIKNATDLNVDIISPDYKMLTKEVVELFHKNNLKIIPWTINDINIINNLKALNIREIITDYPIMMTKDIN